jgi:hypothetical protein
MEHYAGIDVSLERSSVCVVDATGRIVREGPTRLPQWHIIPPPLSYISKSNVFDTVRPGRISFAVSTNAAVYGLLDGLWPTAQLC